MTDLPTPFNDPKPDGQESAERKGPRVILPDATAQTVVESIETAVPVAHVRRPFFGFVASLGLGLVGAAVWAVITLVTDYQIGIVAIVIGLLAGAGARKGGPGRGAQWTGAICAALAYFVGQTTILVTLMLTQPELFEPEQGDTKSQGQAATQPGESPATAAEAEQADTPDWLPSLEEMHPLVGLAVALVAAFVLGVIHTFTSMGIVFLGIAVYEGYRIPRAG